MKHESRAPDLRRRHHHHRRQRVSGGKFERCKIVVCGVAVVALSGCTFNDCEWSFDGPAARTVQFMSALYASGGGARERGASR
jgi:hypothetical protein